MKHLILFTLLLGTVPSLAVAQQPQNQRRPLATPQATAKHLSRAEIDALLQNPAGILLLDVRRPDEVQLNGGFGAYLSIQIADLEKYLAFIPKDLVIVPVSNHASRAEVAAAVLVTHGFKVGGVIGAQTYEAEGGTLVKVVRPPADAGARH